jgi:hypothetical protein
MGSAGIWHEYQVQIFAVAFVVGILGNVVAALVCGVPALFHLHRKLNRQHSERLAQADQHHRKTLRALGVDPDADEPGQ